MNAEPNTAKPIPPDVLARMKPREKKPELGTDRNPENGDEILFIIPRHPGYEEQTLDFGTREQLERLEIGSFGTVPGTLVSAVCVQRHHSSQGVYWAKFRFYPFIDFEPAPEEQGQADRAQSQKEQAHGRTVREGGGIGLRTYGDIPARLSGEERQKQLDYERDLASREDEAAPLKLIQADTWADHYARRKQPYIANPQLNQEAEAHAAMIAKKNEAAVSLGLVPCPECGGARGYFGEHEGEQAFIVKMGTNPTPRPRHELERMRMTRAVNHKNGPIAMLKQVARFHLAHLNYWTAIDGLLMSGEPDAIATAHEHCLSNIREDWRQTFGTECPF